MSRTDSVEAEVIHGIKQELSRLGNAYRSDSACREHYEVFQRLVGRIAAKDIDDPNARFMVTVADQRPHNLDSFALYADEVVRNKDLRLLEFKNDGRMVVQIAEEMVASYMEPRCT